MNQPTKIAILFSGRGSNMQSLAKHIARADVPAEIALTICNRPNAAGIALAEQLGLPCQLIDHKAFATREAFEAAMQSALAKAGIELVCAAGFMRLLGADFVKQWQGRLLNIHPSLLPKYKGLDTHQRALDAGDKIHGCTVHLIRPAMDDGPILVQKSVSILPDDTPDSLAARVLAQEHLAYPEALDMVLAKLRK